MNPEQLCEGMNYYFLPDGSYYSEKVGQYMFLFTVRKVYYEKGMVVKIDSNGGTLMREDMVHIWVKNPNNDGAVKVEL